MNISLTLQYRSSVNFFPIKKIWILPILQVINLVFLICHVLFDLVPSIWIVFAIMFWEGLLGGATYCNAFWLISTEVGLPYNSRYVWISVSVSVSASERRREGEKERKREGEVVWRRYVYKNERVREGWVWMWVSLQRWMSVSDWVCNYLPISRVGRRNSKRILTWCDKCSRFLWDIACWSYSCFSYTCTWTPCTLTHENTYALSKRTFSVFIPVEVIPYVISPLSMRSGGIPLQQIFIRPWTKCVSLFKAILATW